MAKIAAMAPSRFSIRKDNLDRTASCREASEFDFMRGQVGHPATPDIFDDGSLCEQPMNKLKAFTDVGLGEAMSRERWGAAKWVAQQLRIYCVNDFSDHVDKEAGTLTREEILGVAVEYISEKMFVEMLECAWHKEASLAHVRAIMKRTNILVNTSKYIH